MADVFLAVDADDPDARPLVLKRILPHLAQDGSFIRMFLQEARIAMAVRHEHVVQIHRLGEEGGLPFLIMDYVDGLTFRELTRAAERAGLAVPPEVAVDLLLQACTGAHAVHEAEVGDHQEIVHRDLCPHNMMVDHDGHVRLLDFGIAKAAHGMDTTRTGVLKGKTAYLAPEQVRSGSVDRRTDLWALSAVAWELLAGHRLFEGDAEFDTLQRIAQGDIPSLRAAAPLVPPALAETIHRSLSVRPEDRFPDAAALREALLRASRAGGITPDRARTAAFVTQMMRETPSSASPSSPVASVIPDTAPPPPKRASTVGRVLAWGLGFGLVAAVVLAVSVGVTLWALTPAPIQGDPVRFTFAPILPRAEMAEELEPLRQDLQRALGRPVVVQIAPTYESAGTLLASGRTDFAVLPPNLFLNVSASLGSELRPLALTEVDRARGVDGVLIAHRDLPWEGAASLRGRRLCLTDPASATGHALPLRWLADHGLDPERDLAEVVLSGEHHQVIHDVASGRCDVGAVFSGALRGAADADVPVHLTRQVEVTGHTPNDAVCAGPHTDPTLAQAVQSALLAWDPLATQGVRVVGARQRLTGFVDVRVEDYEPLRRALAQDPSAPEAVP